MNCKKIWKTLKPDFTIMEDMGMMFDAGGVPALEMEMEKEGKPELGKLVAESGGECKVKTLKRAVVWWCGGVREAHEHGKKNAFVISFGALHKLTIKAT